MIENRFLEKLLDGAEVEWKRLGYVAEIGTGCSNRQDESENGKYPFYVRSKNVLKSNTYQFDETAIIEIGLDINEKTIKKKNLLLIGMMLFLRLICLNHKRLI